MSIISSKFPTLKASGEKRTANQKEIETTGKIVGYVPINNPQYPQMVAKIQIKVDGENQLFEDVINLNDSTEAKAKDSLGFLQQHTKEAMLSAGKQADFNDEVDFTWCDTQLELLAHENATVKFRQQMETKNGKSSLKIHYIK